MFLSIFLSHQKIISLEKQKEELLFQNSYFIREIKELKKSNSEVIVKFKQESSLLQNKIDLYDTELKELVELVSKVFNEKELKLIQGNDQAQEYNNSDGLSQISKGNLYKRKKSLGGDRNNRNQLNMESGFKDKQISGGYVGNENKSIEKTFDQNKLVDGGKLYQSNYSNISNLSNNSHRIMPAKRNINSNISNNRNNFNNDSKDGDIYNEYIDNRKNNIDINTLHTNTNLTLDDISNVQIHYTNSCRDNQIN